MLLPIGGNAKLSDVSKTNNGHLGQTLSCYSQAKKKKNISPQLHKERFSLNNNRFLKKNQGKQRKWQNKQDACLHAYICLRQRGVVRLTLCCRERGGHQRAWRSC